LVRNGVVTATEVELAFRAVDRCNFVAEEQGPNAYLDRALDIGFNVQISAPHVHACSLGLLVDWLSKGGTFLDIGSGSGFMSAAMATIAQGESCIHGREHIPELAAASVDNIRKGNPELLSKGGVIISASCGLNSDGGAIDGCVEREPPKEFDAINCGAAFETIPEKLINQVRAFVFVLWTRVNNSLSCFLAFLLSCFLASCCLQLKPGGRLVVPIGTVGEPQWLTVIDKAATRATSSDAYALSSRRVLRVVYVPFTDRTTQLS
jgi:protein-L-isoaspartate(D-aspartate) O-methyltransferase